MFTDFAYKVKISGLFEEEKYANGRGLEAAL